MRSGSKPSVANGVDAAHVLQPEAPDQPLVDQRAVDEAVGDDDRPAGQRRRDHLGHDLGPGGGEQERLGARRERGRGVEHQRADPLSGGRPAGLAHLDDLAPAAAQVGGQEPGLGRLAAAVDALEGHEARRGWRCGVGGDGDGRYLRARRDGASPAERACNVRRIRLSPARPTQRQRQRQRGALRRPHRAGGHHRRGAGVLVGRSSAGGQPRRRRPPRSRRRRPTWSRRRRTPSPRRPRSRSSTSGQTDAFVVPAFARQSPDSRRDSRARRCVSAVSTAETRDLDVRDVCGAYVGAVCGAARTAAASILNIASGVPRRIGDILEELLSLAGLDIEVATDAARLRGTEIVSASGDAGRRRSNCSIGRRG